MRTLTLALFLSLLPLSAVAAATAMDIENGCREAITAKWADVSFPGFRDMGTDQGKPVAFDKKGNAVWRSWARLRGVQRWFRCRYTAKTDVVTVSWD